MATLLLSVLPLAVVFLISVVFTQSLNNQSLQQQLAAKDDEKDSRKKSFNKVASNDEDIDLPLADPTDKDKDGSFDI